MARDTIDCPDNKVVEEGIEAYCLFRPRSSCPYPQRSAKERDCLCGWDEASRIDFEEGDREETRH